MNETNLIQVLITTVKRDNILELLDNMNISTPAIVGNQLKEDYSYDEIAYKDNRIMCFNFVEKGVGLNRNNLLMRASAKYCLFGDDDLIYYDDYENILLAAFRRHESEIVN